LYGLRTLSPFVLGIGDVRTSRFVFLNAAGAVLWTLSIGLIGYAFGEIVTMLLGRAKHYEAYILGGILVVCISAAYALHRRAKNRPEPQVPPSEG
jgi:membrane protein DedA with SNARE-associated domain